MKIVMVQSADVWLYKFKVEKLLYPGFRQVLEEINSSTVRKYSNLNTVFARKKYTKFPEEHLHTGLSWKTVSVQLEVEAYRQLEESKHWVLHYATVHVQNNNNSIISLS